MNKKCTKKKTTKEIKHIDCFRTIQSHLKIVKVSGVITPTADVFHYCLHSVRLKKVKIIRLRISSDVFRSRLNRLDPKAALLLAKY